MASNDEWQQQRFWEDLNKMFSFPALEEAKAVKQKELDDWFNNTIKLGEGIDAEMNKQVTNNNNERL